MTLKDCFDTFFKETGTSKKWFAEKIGISVSFFYQIIAGKHPLPPKYWAAIIEYSLGKITLADLLKDYVDKHGALQVDSVKADKCLVSLRKPNK